MATSLVDSRKAISPSMSFSEDDAPSPEAAPAEDENDDDDAEREEVKLTFLFLNRCSRETSSCSFSSFPVFFVEIKGP